MKGGYRHLSAKVGSARDEPLQSLAEKVKPAVVTILTYDDKGEPLAQGSGFFTSSQGHVMTNRHVLKDAYQAKVETAEGSCLEIRQVLAEDRDADLIEVAVDPTEVEALQIQPLHRVRRADPMVGERVFVVGCPEGLERTVTEGIISAVREYLKYGQVFQISAAISPGSSGSPVLNVKSIAVAKGSSVDRE